MRSKTDYPFFATLPVLIFTLLAYEVLWQTGREGNYSDSPTTMCHRDHIIALAYGGHYYKNLDSPPGQNRSPAVGAQHHTTLLHSTVLPSPYQY